MKPGKTGQFGLLPVYHLLVVRIEAYLDALDAWKEVEVPGNPTDSDQELKGEKDPKD